MAGPVGRDGRHLAPAGGAAGPAVAPAGSCSTAGTAAAIRACEVDALRRISQRRLAPLVKLTRESMFDTGRVRMAESLATERDERHLRRAIELGSEARGRTSRNPLVGAVMVKDGRTIGEGFHAAAGMPHAEREALSACTADPAGATMYVSLEPCCHHGRTPPCTEAIVDARLARVVVASDDPSEKASGRGLGMLRDEGIRVDVVDGAVASAARMMNQPFRKHAKTGRPLVTWKTAMTLDGKVATAGGDSRWISNEASRARAHRWRAEADAVAVGIGTALADDPLLTARVEGVYRQPRRGVFDSEARLPVDSALSPPRSRRSTATCSCRPGSRSGECSRASLREWRGCAASSPTPVACGSRSRPRSRASCATATRSR